MGCNPAILFILYFSGGANLGLTGFNLHCIHHARLTYFIGSIKVSKVSIWVKIPFLLSCDNEPAYEF